MRQEFQYKNFIYILDENNNHVVETIPDIPIPSKIYKYYSISENSMNALEELKLYSTHPFLFNDSIDSSELLLDFKNISEERYISFFNRMLTPEEFNKYDWKENYVEDKDDNFNGIRNFTYANFSRNYGLISLTTVPFNILMWSHYTSETGFVIGFETQSLLSDIKYNKDINNYCFRPIQYVDKVEKIDMFHSRFSTPDVPFLYITTVKRDNWQYEDEWRLSIYKNSMDIPFGKLYPAMKTYPGKEDRFFRYQKESIESISLGKHFFNGSNCELTKEGNIFVLHKRFDENKESDERFINFVNHLINNYNDKLYMSGELERGNILLRSLGRIKIEKISEKEYKIIDLKEIKVQD
ncbi:DUF2971 domain-containing protein [Chryseobacterium bernardetii]|uniref:DUF2971 domain-containing protein n=1 Tax=Chryseobacterium bernardetii TaxID=1241978 RepID=UPI000F4F930E|nr:DUF2971 domain-containing protein [Chryseobacterium bernardetii]AZB34254.1 DUF2971 domain-containing protein [Chryseobacterium bernardetii]